MTNKDREQIIKNAISGYKAAKASGNVPAIHRAINDMENAFMAVSLWAVKGTDELRKCILQAREEAAK